MQNENLSFLEIEIGEALKRLFLLHDRPLSSEKGAVFVAEIIASGLDKKPILEGIKSLELEECKTLSLARVMGSIRAHNEPRRTEEKSTRCRYCHKVGVVAMVDSDKRECVLACVCSVGDREVRGGLSRWNGEGSQFVNGRLLTLIWRDILEFEDEIIKAV